MNISPIQKEQSPILEWSAIFYLSVNCRLTCVLFSGIMTVFTLSAYFCAKVMFQRFNVDFDAKLFMQFRSVFKYVWSDIILVL